MPLIDSHAHLDFYTEDLPAVLARAQAAGIHTILAIGIGEGPATMHRALEIAHAFHKPAHPNIYASAGIHPQEAHQATPENLTKLTTLAADPRCIAIGEIGLDYYHLDNPLPEIQQAAFIAQMHIAAAARKPILIHCRTSELATPQAKAKFEAHGNPEAAWEDLLALIAQHWTPHHNLGWDGLDHCIGKGGEPMVPTPTQAGIMHCFSGNLDQARQSLAAGFHLSFAGNLTYPKSTHIRAAATLAPADRILIETDAPFLAPIPHRGQQNEPALITHTAATLATLRGITPEELATLTTANFHRLFPTTKDLVPGT